MGTKRDTIIKKCSKGHILGMLCYRVKNGNSNKIQRIQNKLWCPVCQIVLDGTPVEHVIVIKEK